MSREIVKSECLRKKYKTLRFLDKSLINDALDSQVLYIMTFKRIAKQVLWSN